MSETINPFAGLRSDREIARIVDTLRCTDFAAWIETRYGYSILMADSFYRWNRLAFTAAWEEFQASKEKS